MRRIPQLPEELVEEILIRLQVKELLRFKSVCKLWNRIIRSPHFIRRHLDHSKAHPSHHRILSPYRKSSMKTIDCSDLFAGEVVTNDLPPPFKPEVTFLGTCDGLVSYYNERTKRIFLWNPATRMCKSLVTLEEVDDDEGITYHWFGHESDDDDEYKLVVGCSVNLTNVIHLINPFAADVDGWKSTLELEKLTLQFGAGTLFNRRVHWAALHFSGDNVGSFFIFSFDLRSRTVVEIPGHEGTAIMEFATLCVINGCLSAIHRTKRENRTIFEVWTMKEYGVKKSWTKLTTILSDIYVRPCPKNHYPFLCVVKVTDKGDLVVKVEERQLMVCNLAEGKSRYLMANRKGSEVMYVVESLVFPTGVPIVGYLPK